MASTSICTVVITLFLTSVAVCDSASIQAAIDVDKSIDGMLDIILGNLDLEENALSKKKAADFRKVLMFFAPMLTIRGNITDSSKMITLSFDFEASTGADYKQSREQLLANSKPAEDDENENINWRGTGGIFHPIVKTLEPYVVEALNLVFNGILSTIIGNFLASATMLQEVNLI